jgi:simple sugar transport system ATP-binding protein
LVDELSVYHNLFLNREHTRGGWFRFLSNRTMRAAASRFLEDIGKILLPSKPQWRSCPAVSGQAIAVVRPVRQQNIKILLLDEPLSAMGAKETSLIIGLIKSLSKKANMSIIVIDHNYTHLFEICDRINVIQHGQVTLDKSLSEIKLHELVEFMVQNFRREVGSEGARS